MPRPLRGVFTAALIIPAMAGRPGRQRAGFQPVREAELPDRIELAYAPRSPDLVYASVNQNSGEVWGSTNGGQTFSLISTGYSYLGGQGWYDNIIWVDPSDANTVIVGGIDLWRSKGGAYFYEDQSVVECANPAHADSMLLSPILILMAHRIRPFSLAMMGVYKDR